MLEKSEKVQKTKAVQCTNALGSTLSNDDDGLWGVFVDSGMLFDVLLREW